MIMSPTRSLAVAIALTAMTAIGLSQSIRAGSPPQTVRTDGVVRVKSAYGVEDTIARLKADIAGKGIMFFSAVDQSKLAADAGITLRPSTLLIFGNPPLSPQFITANSAAGLD
jgi:uncharacterized protein (DUF302 family)